ncbi:MAG: chromosome condensation regulator RCC1 [Hyperionvirus sp.]|uniref:Chromosome condensation regulator RCC1 n=1 Tax=Hyperionvirus sp. TaxID=2487770 RepID=A0A3G5A877_9VIRU|nr:MAG: chromosome condensation regulator RCC1 [Hyperionvirus sp.]
MELILLIRNLPIDLLYIVSGYDHRVVLLLGEESALIKCDWFLLIKLNFSLIYERKISTQKEIMKVYFDNCSNEKPRIVCGTSNTILRLSDGRLMGCGNNCYGQLGLGDNKCRNLFFEISGIPKNIVEVICCTLSTIIRLGNGTLMTCGYNLFGQLGLGDNESRYKFTKIAGIPKDIVEIICGDHHVIIRLACGTLMGCGLNNYGQLGVGDYENRNEFCVIPNIPKNIEEVLCNNYCTIIRLACGTLMACGYNGCGRLGFGNDYNINRFKEIPGVPKNIARVVCGLNHTVILLRDGTLMSCGSNYYGQLGLGDNVNRGSFQKINGIPENIVDVVGNFYHVVIRLTDGTLMSCGSNERRQLGLGDCLNRNTFFEIRGVPKNVAKVILDVLFTVVILTDGTLIDLANCESKRRPLSALGEIEMSEPKNIVEVIGADDYIIIRLRDGTIMSCGSNSYGELGLGDEKYRNSFEKINGIPKIKS